MIYLRVFVFSFLFMVNGFALDPVWEEISNKDGIKVKEKKFIDAQKFFAASGLNFI